VVRVSDKYVKKLVDAPGRIEIRCGPRMGQRSRMRRAASFRSEFADRDCAGGWWQGAHRAESSTKIRDWCVGDVGLYFDGQAKTAAHLYRLTPPPRAPPGEANPFAPASTRLDPKQGSSTPGDPLIGFIKPHPPPHPTAHELTLHSFILRKGFSPPGREAPPGRPPRGEWHRRICSSAGRSSPRLFACGV